MSAEVLTGHESVGSFDYERLSRLASQLSEATDSLLQADYMVGALYPDTSRELSYRETAEVAYKLRDAARAALEAEAELFRLVPQAREF